MTYCVWWSILQIGQSHPTGLTTNLLKLFEPRAPLEFKPPPEKRKCPPYQGMALVLLVLFWFQSALWQCTRILALQIMLSLCRKDRVLCFYYSYSNFFLSYLCITVKKIASTSFTTVLWFQSLSIGLFRALLWSFGYFPSYSVLFLEQLVYHTFAAWWRRFYQPASWMLHIDFSAWALVSFNLPSGPWVSFLQNGYLFDWNMQGFNNQKSGWLWPTLTEVDDWCCLVFPGSPCSLAFHNM